MHPHTTIIEKTYPNVHLTIGPMNHTKNDAITFIENPKNDPFDKYRAHLTAIITYFRFDNPSFKRLDGATWGSTFHLDVSRILGIEGELLAIAILVNGLLLNINKLPEAPLTFERDMVNGLPLKNFVILPTDEISTWNNIESKESKLWAAFLEYRA